MTTGEPMAGVGAPGHRAGSSVPRVRPGDALVVGRILTFWQWLRRPISSLISWRIQRSTASKWNHVACYLGNGRIAEAEWNRGVRTCSLREAYGSGLYRVAIVRPPPYIDRAQAVTRWQIAASESRGLRSYSIRTLILMRVAAILFGAQGIRKVIRNHPDDGAWICSELGAYGWAQESRLICDVLVTPADFMDDFAADLLGVERVLVADPRAIELEG